MIDLSKPVLDKYREQVFHIYKQLQSSPWCSLDLFEYRMRKISVLNAKIKNKATDIKRDTEDEVL